MLARHRIDTTCGLSLQPPARPSPSIQEFCSASRGRSAVERRQRRSRDVRPHVRHGTRHRNAGKFAQFPDVWRRIRADDLKSVPVRRRSRSSSVRDRSAAPPPGSGSSPCGRRTNQVRSYACADGLKNSRRRRWETSRWVHAGRHEATPSPPRRTRGQIKLRGKRRSVRRVSTASSQ